MNSMERLLLDAKRMRKKEKKDDEGFSIIDETKNIISKIITVDFFLVCGLLVWFMTGIFFSSVLKNNFIQIAFNNRFETIVQPNLGIIMTGSAAGGKRKPAC